MAVFLRGGVYHCEFMWQGRRVRKSTRQTTIGRARLPPDGTGVHLKGTGKATGKIRYGPKPDGKLIGRGEWPDERFQ